MTQVNIIPKTKPVVIHFKQGDYVKHNTKDILILVTFRQCSDKTFSGVVIAAGEEEGYKFGHYSEMWDKDMFSDFEGKIEIDTTK